MGAGYNLAMSEDTDDKNDELPGSGKTGKIARGALQAVGGLIPFDSRLFSAAAGAWSEEEQRRVNEFLHGLLQILQDEIPIRPLRALIVRGL